MNAKNSMAEKPCIHLPLVGTEQHEERKCGVCKIAMQPLHQSQEDSKLPWRERGIDYDCVNCQKQVYVANSNSVTIAVGSAILIGTFIGYLLVAGLFDFIVYSVQSSLLSVLLSLIAIAIMAVAARYAWGRIKRAAELIEGRIKHPMVNKKPGINMLNLSMTMGLLPWLIAMLLGYVNNEYALLKGNMIWLMAPLTLIPIFLGKTVGSTKMNVFLATIFWLFVGASVIWLAS